MTAMSAVRSDDAGSLDPGPLELARAWQHIAGQTDEIADEISVVLLDRDGDVYDRVGPELRADVRASCRQHVRKGIDVLTGDVARSDAAELWRETGRRRARQGVPLELVLHAYTVGTRLMWEALVDRAPGAGIGDRVLLAAASTVWANLDTQNAVLVDAYRRERSRLERQDLQRQQAALDALVEGRGADPEVAEEARVTLGLGTDDDLACLVVLHDGVRGAADAMAAMEDRLERSGVVARWHLRPGVTVGLLAGDLPGERELAALVEPSVPARAGVALAPGGLAGFATAHLLATRTAETLGREERRVVPVTDRLPEVLLAGSPVVTPLLVEQGLGGLLGLPAPQREVLLATLAALLRHDGSPTRAADDLFCHRNTVIYRLKRIEDLTARSLADPRDKMLLALALAAHGHG